MSGAVTLSRRSKREWMDLKENMLDRQRKEQLSEISSFRRWFITGSWVLKSLFFRLKVARRILLVVGLFKKHIVFHRNVRFSGDRNGGEVLCVLFVLRLELKDKALGRKELETGREIQNQLSNASIQTQWKTGNVSTYLSELQTLKGNEMPIFDSTR